MDYGWISQIEHLVESWTKKAFQHMVAEDFKRLKADREYKDNVIGSMLADEAISEIISQRCLFANEYVETLDKIKDTFWSCVEKEIAKREKTVDKEQFF